VISQRTRCRNEELEQNSILQDLTNNNKEIHTMGTNNDCGKVNEELKSKLITNSGIKSNQ
jgi:hypothetical protein